jgi:hypothetical protein
MENGKISDFDQRTACRALICWSKYTTAILIFAKYLQIKKSTRKGN